MIEDIENKGEEVQETIHTVAIPMAFKDFSETSIQIHLKCAGTKLAILTTPKINPEWEKLGPEANMKFLTPGKPINIGPEPKPTNPYGRCFPVSNVHG